MSTETPVLVIAFNRPDHIQTLLKALQTFEASNVYFAIDAPRTNRIEDVAKVDQVIRLIRTYPWFSEKRFWARTENLGVRRGPESAITWFFKQEDRGVILEDDCIPGESFFPFVEWALREYADEPRIRVVSGFNPFQEVASSTAGFWIKTAWTWGWATWRRAWEKNDPDLLSWDVRDARVQRWLGHKAVRHHWDSDTRGVRGGRLKAWDIPWAASIFREQGLCLMPRVSLVQNIGFGADATHTSQGDDRRLVVPRSLPPPFSAPPLDKINLRFQRRLDRGYFWSGDVTLTGKVWNAIRRLKRLVLGQH